MRSYRIVSALIVLLLATSACGPRGPRLEQLDAEALYAHAMQQYEARRWGPAAEAFERFIFVFPGHPLQQDARFHLAETHYERREFLTAATVFIRLASDFPAGPLAPEARFRACAAYERL
jgi:outer membrane protein assembly factor BamD